MTPHERVVAHVRMPRVSEVVPSPDGRWAVAVVDHLDKDQAKYKSALWRVSLVDDAAPVRLTRGEHGDSRPRFRGDGALLFLSQRPTPHDDKGAESRRSQVWVMAEGAEPMPLTDEPLGVGSFEVAADGDALVLITPVLPGVEHDKQRETADDRREHGPSVRRYTQMPVRFWDHWLPEAAPHLVAHVDGKRVDRTPDANREHRQSSGVAVSRDGRFAVLERTRPGKWGLRDAALEIFDLGPDGGSRLIGVEERLNLWSPAIDPTGDRIACLHVKREEGQCIDQRVAVIDVATGDIRVLGQALPGWPHAVTWDGDSIVATVPDHGNQTLWRIDPQTGEAQRITPEGAQGTWGAVRVHQGRVVGLCHTQGQAPEVFVSSAQPGSTPQRRSTLSGGADPDVVWSSEWVDGDGGDPVQYFVVRPREIEGAAPVLFMIHGGPMSSWLDCWHWRWNAGLFAALGFVVVCPNPRGSTGFGQDFVAGVWGNTWGAACYRDLVAVVDALAERPDTDTSRMACMGGSFGGYMTNWIATQPLGERFRCMVSHAGLFSLSGFVGTTDSPMWWRFSQGDDLWNAGVDWVDMYSPHRQVAAWKAPTLIIHGEKDYRVPVAEALQLFDALQAHGVESELMLFPDENHWILKPRNIVTWYEGVMEWLGRYLD